MRKLLFVVCIGIFIVLGIGCTANQPEEPEILPEISEEAIVGSKSVIGMYSEVNAPEVEVEGNKITFYLTPANEDVPKERLRELSILFMKALSGYTVNDGLAGPTDESYGEIYNYYNVEIIVDKTEGEVLDKATKAKGKKEIQWQ